MYISTVCVPVPYGTGHDRNISDGYDWPRCVEEHHIHFDPISLIIAGWLPQMQDAP